MKHSVDKASNDSDTKDVKQRVEQAGGIRSKFVGFKGR